jgi:hypothetical protein
MHFTAPVSCFRHGGQPRKRQVVAMPCKVESLVHSADLLDMSRIEDFGTTDRKADGMTYKRFAHAYAIKELD